MGKINGCLKCLFIFFNAVYAVIGCILIYGLVKVSVFSSQLTSLGAPGLGWGWLIAISIVGISCLGIYAGSSEKPLAIKIFAGFMGAGIIVMMSFGIYIAVTRNTVKDAFTNSSSETSQAMMQQDIFRTYLDGIQSSLMCCGLTDARDWGSNIPSSCECSRGGSGGYGGYGGFAGLGQSGCKDRPQGTSGPSRIYSQTCGNVIFSVADIGFKILMGIFFGFAVTALLGLLISLLMLHQIKRHDGAGIASFSMKG